MISIRFRIIWLAVIWGFGMGSVHADTTTNTTGLLCNSSNAFPGLTLFSSLAYRNSYLINNAGEVVHVWHTDLVPGNTQYLRDNGNLVRTADPGGDYFFIGGDAGLVQEFDWEGNLVWEFNYNTTNVRAHHDIAILPNSNILMIAWERKTSAEALAAGRDPSFLRPSDNYEVWPDHIIEVQPDGPTNGIIVWEWHAWDHLIQDFSSTQSNFGVVADHPELININYGRDDRADWMHSNAIDYNADLDQILLSVPWHDEIWVIDHSTTSAEAAGHTGGISGKGGAILYRWGNPEAYDRGTDSDQTLYRQHGANWIKPGLPGAGNILLFNNGPRPAGAFSTADEIVPPVDTLGVYTNPLAGESFAPDAAVWSFQTTPNTNMFSGGLSGVDRQPNGNTLICEGGAGDFREVTPSSNIVWRYLNPVDNSGPVQQGMIDPNATFRADRYPLTHPAFAARDLTPQGTLEYDPTVEQAVTELISTDDGVRVRWASQTEKSYELQHTTSLVSGVWSTVVTFTAIGTHSYYPGEMGLLTNSSQSFIRSVLID